MSHTCHAHGCKIAVPPKMFMCRTHWYDLPLLLRNAIWHEYRPGQERTKDPSCRYLAVSFLCISRVAFKPNDEAAAKVSAHYLALALAVEMQEAAIKDGAGDPLAGLVPDQSEAL